MNPQPKPIKVFLTYTDAEFAAYYSQAGLAELSRHAEVLRNTTGRVLEGAELAEAAAGCQVIVAHRSAPGHAATFANAPHLVAFLRGAVDISTIDVEAASRHGVLVTRATAGFSDAVAELGLGMMIDLARGVTRAGIAQRAGQIPSLPKGIQLSASTMGLVGYGRIARRLAEMAKAIGMHVRAFDPHADAARYCRCRVFLRGGARAVRLRCLPCCRHSGDREPDECDGVRGNEAGLVLHQSVAR